MATSASSSLRPPGDGAPKCPFCGSRGPFTNEHLFGRWLSRIGLSSDPVAQVAGLLNELGREMGAGPPFRTRVREVCASCNNGWMSGLETVAQQVLPPRILGTSGPIAASARLTIAHWAHKTALVGLLLSSKEERGRGQGMPAEEYSKLRQSVLSGVAVPRTTVWIGQYTGSLRLGMTRVVPIVLRRGTVLDPSFPDGYVFTLVIGELLVLGVRFTGAAPSAPVWALEEYLESLWPPGLGIGIPAFQTVGDDDFPVVAAGALLSLQQRDLRIARWSPASDLPESKLRGEDVELPLLCRRHVAFYPAVLVREAGERRFYSFITSCECGNAYLVRTQSDGAHVRDADAPALIEARYESLRGEEFEITTRSGMFLCKRVQDGSSFRRHV